MHSNWRVVERRTQTLTAPSRSPDGGDCPAVYSMHLLCFENVFDHADAGNPARDGPVGSVLEIAVFLQAPRCAAQCDVRRRAAAREGLGSVAAQSVGLVLALFFEQGQRACFDIVGCRKFIAGKCLRVGTCT